MKGLSLIIVIGILMISCHLKKTGKKSFNELEFSFNNTFGNAYSIKFTRNDTIYVSRYFPWPTRTFRGILSPIQERTIDSFINEIPFSKLDTLYYEGYVDGSCYQVYLKTDSLEKRIFVHSYDSSPAKLNQFALWLVKMKNRLSLSPIDTSIKFINNSNFAPKIPPMIKDTIKYTTPKIEYN